MDRRRRYCIHRCAPPSITRLAVVQATPSTNRLYRTQPRSSRGLPSNRFSSHNPASLFTMASNPLASYYHSPTVSARLCPPDGPMPNGAQSAVPFPGNMVQANGVPGSSAGPPPAGVAPPQGLAAQRPGAPQQRGPNGVPFQSPTTAHSPPNPPNGPGTSQPTSGLGPVGANQSVAHADEPR